MKILITGGSGFIGSHLSSLLKRKKYDFLSPLSSELNLLDKKMTKQYLIKNDPKIIFHLASKGVSKEFSNNVQMNSKNLKMLKNIENSINSDALLIVAGSMSEYGYSGYLSENDECHPKTEYGKSKFSITKYSLNSRNKNNIRICRIYSVYGFGEKENRLFPSISIANKENKFCLLSDGMQKRDFIHVQDVCNCLLKIALIPQENEIKIVNIGTGIPLGIKEVAQKYARNIGMNNLYLKFGAIPRAPEDQDLIAANTNYLKKLLGFIPPQRLLNKDISNLFDKNFKIKNF